LDWNVQIFGRAEHGREVHSLIDLQDLVSHVPVPWGASLQGDDLIRLRNGVELRSEEKFDIEELVVSIQIDS
jgi:hypothetical protein